MSTNTALVIALTFVALGTMIRMWTWRPSSFSNDAGEW